MGTVLTLAFKDLRVLFRDKWGVFWTFAFPLLYCVFFGVIFGSSGDDGGSAIPIAVVDEARNEKSARLVRDLAAHDSLSIARTEGSRGEGEDAVPELRTLEDARAAVRKGRVVAYIRIPSGYGDSPFAMFDTGVDTPRVEVGLDPSRNAEAGILQGVLMGTMFESMAEGFTDKDAIQEQIARGATEVAAADDVGSGQKLVLQTFFGALNLFIEEIDLEVLEEGTSGVGVGENLVDVVDVARDVENRPRSAFDITFPQAMVWGLMSVAMGFAATLVRERTQGTLLRLRIAPLSRAQLVAGKGLGCYLTCLVVMSVLLVFGYVALGVRVESPLYMALAMLCTAASFTGLMMAASTLGKTEQAVAGAAWGVMMPFAMIGGGMIPLVAMPPWLVAASDFSPFKWSIYSLEGAAWRGFTFAEMLAPSGIQLAIGAAFFAFGVWAFHRAER
jgi:ABC-2 type transport system permease protein